MAPSAIGALHRLQLLPIPTQVVAVASAQPTTVVRATPATTHVVTHNLGRLPIVSVTTLDGRPMIVDVVTSDTTITVQSIIPITCTITYY